MSNDTAAIGINESLINGFVNVFFGVVGLVANLIIVVCFVRVPRVRTVNCAYLITSIALTDIIFSGSVIAQSAQNLIQPTISEVAVHCLVTQVAAILATAAGAAFLACLAIDRYEAACEPYDYQLKDHFKFGVYSFMVSWCFGLLVAVMFTSFRTQFTILQTTSCPLPDHVMQSYWWVFQLAMSVLIVLLMVRAYARMSVQIKYSENNSTSTVRAIGKQARVTAVATLVIAVTVLTVVLPHMAAIILYLTDPVDPFERLVVYLCSCSALASALRPIVILTRYHALRSHVNLVFRRHSSSTAVGPHMELFAIDAKDPRQSVITLY